MPWPKEPEPSACRWAPTSVGRSATRRSSSGSSLAIPLAGRHASRFARRAGDDRAVRSAPAGCKYDLVVDRLTHWYHTSREWIKKAIVIDDLYVFNNPWAIQSNEKHTTYCAMMRLGMPIPETWMIPPKAYEPNAGPASRRSRATRSSSTSARSASKLGYPMFMKPYDGGGWRGVTQDRRRAGAAARPTTRAASPSCTCRRRSIPTTGSCAASASARRPHCVLYDPGGAAARPLHAWTTDFSADGGRAAPARHRR